jgi:outer membrane protein
MAMRTEPWRRLGFVLFASVAPAMAGEPPERGGQPHTQAEDTSQGTEARRGDPLWEIGVIGGGGTLPDYPAADQNHARGLALPYAVYRGPVLRVGDGGIIRGKLIDTSRIEFNLALDGSFPADSEDNEAREGMPDLDTLLEAGPRLIFKFLPPDWDQELNASIAARAVFSTDLPINWRYQGFVINPRLSYGDERFHEGRLRLGASIGPLFGFGGLNRYFYEVQPQFARPGRREYDADGGYIGTELSLSVSWLPFSRVRLFSAMQLGYFNGSANENSPLHRDDLNLAAGAGLRLAIFQSERRVPR